MKLQMKFGFKKAVNGICHCYGFIIHGVLIYVFKHVVCRVPHAFHCVFIGDIEPKHDRCVYMAEVVEAERLDSAAGARALQMLIQDISGCVDNNSSVRGDAANSPIIYGGTFSFLLPL